MSSPQRPEPTTTFSGYFWAQYLLQYNNNNNNNDNL